YAWARHPSRQLPSVNRPGRRRTVRPMRRTLAFVCYTPTLGTVRVRHRGAGLMNHNFASKVGLALIACSLAGIVVGQTQPAAFQPQLSENVYKNIQILKGLPGDQLMTAMRYGSYSMGVKCSFVHVCGALETRET